MKDPLLGELTYSDDVEGYVSAPRAVPFLRGHAVRFVFSLAEDERPSEAMHAAVASALRAGPEVLAAAEPHVLRYRADMLTLRGDKVTKLQPPSDVWSHVTFGDELCVSQREADDAEDGVYLSLECNCDWEEEHGLQLVVRDGTTISKVGPYDDHLTNADACNDPSRVGVVYATTKGGRRG